MTADLARIIDHTLLKPEATAADVQALVAEAVELGTYAVCVSPTMVGVVRAAILAQLVPGAPTPSLPRVAAVCGFPSGAHHPNVKALEARQAVDDGADEIDMVINLAHHGGDLDAFAASVFTDVQTVREAIPGTLLKVIIEAAVLTDDEIVAACQAAERGGAQFVKTSTGFHPAGGATVHAVELMRATVGDRLGVKASGGIRDRATAEAMIAAGASRLGLSSARAVLSGAEATSSY